MSHREALAIGLLRGATTVPVEFFMGLALLKHALAQVPIEYDLDVGRAWELFFLGLAVAPWLCFPVRSAST